MATVHEFLKSRVRHLCSAVLILLGLVTIIPAFSGTVSAHHAEASASVGCDGIIHYTVSSWAGDPDNPDTPQDENALSRGNPSVRVWVEIIGGSGVPPADQFGAFTSPGFSFSGTFVWPTGATIVFVKVEAIANWDSGDAPGSGPWPVFLPFPENCDGSTTTVEETTTTVEETTTTVEETTTTTEDPTTTTTEDPTTTTTENSTTTTTGGGNTTTTVGGGATTTTVGGGNTTTTVGGGGGTTPTSVSGTLPRSGGGGQSKPMLSMALGLACIGSALMLSRPRAPKRVTAG
jgi:hypothetical protein